MIRMTVWRISRMALEGEPLPLRSLVAQIRRIWPAQIATQHINASLPVLRPLIGQPRHGIHAGQPDGWAVRRLPSLLGSCGEPFVQCPSALLVECFFQLRHVAG